MIKSFSWMYVGWVDMEDAGFDGTPADLRRYSNDQLATVFDHEVELAQAMDGLGYDALWSAEHHFQHDGYECVPNLLMLFVHLASQTKRLRFGCGINLAPIWHPLRLAEDYAVADILTKGRVIFGVGRGYQTREMETLGAPVIDDAANRDLFEESMELILKAWRQESFSHQGKRYTIPPPVPYRGRTLREITLVPRPIRQPVEVWQIITSGADRALDFMAKHGIKGIIAVGGPRSPDDVMRRYQAAATRHGRELGVGEDLCFYMPCHIADSRRQAAREVHRFHEESLKRTTPLVEARLFKRLTDEQLRLLTHPSTARSAGLPTLEQLVENDPFWLYGPAEETIGALRQIEEKYPSLEHVILHPPEMTHKSIMLEQIRRFAGEVMPAFPHAMK